MASAPLLLIEGIDPARQGQARELARRKYALMALGAAVSLVYVLAYPLWLSRPLANALAASGWPGAVQFGLFALVMGAAYEALTLPLAWYGTFVLPHRYGLSTQTLRAWLIDVLKGWGIALVLGLIAMEGLYACLRYAPGSWWLWCTAFAIALVVALSFVAPVLLAPIFFKFTPLGDTPLARRLTELAERCGTHVQGVYSVNFSSKTTAANAALMGMGRTRRIVLGDTLLDRYADDESEAVLAHELAHHVHHDIWRGIVFSGIELAVIFWLAQRALDIAIGWGLASAPADPRALPVIALALGVLSTLLSPLSAWHTRRLERQADDFAVETVGASGGLVSAMVKLANQNLAVVDPHPLIEWLFYDHPAIGRRIRRALTLRPAQRAGAA